MFTGSMVAMVTPMHDDGSVDWDALERLVEHHIAQATDAIVSVGTTGESATLDHDEHGEVIARTVKVYFSTGYLAGSGVNCPVPAADVSDSKASGQGERAFQAAGQDGAGPRNAYRRNRARRF